MLFRSMIDLKGVLTRSLRHVLLFGRSQHRFLVTVPSENQPELDQEMKERLTTGHSSSTPDVDAFSQAVSGGEENWIRREERARIRELLKRIDALQKEQDVMKDVSAQVELLTILREHGILEAPNLISKLINWRYGLLVSPTQTSPKKLDHQVQ
jgi:hypothetical protein